MAPSSLRRTNAAGDRAYVVPAVPVTAPCRCHEIAILRYLRTKDEGNGLARGPKAAFKLVNASLTGKNAERRDRANP